MWKSFTRDLPYEWYIGVWQTQEIFKYSVTTHGDTPICWNTDDNILWELSSTSTHPQHKSWWRLVTLSINISFWVCTIPLFHCWNNRWSSKVGMDSVLVTINITTRRNNLSQHPNSKIFLFHLTILYIGSHKKDVSFEATLFWYKCITHFCGIQF
jgi:hypothetical protein